MVTLLHWLCEMTFEKELHEALEAVQAANALVREQEDKIATTKTAGVNMSQADSLLAAYRAFVRYALERRDLLEGFAQAQ